MVKKEVVFLISAVFIVLFSLNFVSTVHTTSPGSLILNQSQYYLFNITINNTNIGQVGNITQVYITLPGGSLFINNSNGTSINTTWGAYYSGIAAFTNTSNVLTWTNTTSYLINGSIVKSYFWFNASVPAVLGNHNITITSVNQTGIYSTNLSITVNDITPPGVTRVYPADGANYSLSSISFNISVADNTNGSGIFACNYTLDSGETNLTMSNTSASAFNATNSSILNTLYTATFYCFDQSGNVNRTTTSRFRIDTLAPLLRISYPTNGLNLSSRLIRMENITVNDSHGAVIGVGMNYTNITIYNSLGVVVNSTVINNTAGNGNFTTNLTVPSDGTYSIFAIAYDNLYTSVSDFQNHMNQTSLTIKVDTIAPTLTVLNPINNTNYYANQSILIHLSRSDTTSGTLWYTYNATVNQSLGALDTGSASIYYNSTGIKNITFCTNDTFNNITSINYIINITAALPTAAFIANDTTYTVPAANTSLVVPYNSTLQNVSLSNESQKFSLDLSQIMSNSTVTLGANPFTLLTTGTYNYTAYIPASTTITGPADWDGKINLPTKNASTFSGPSISGYTTTQNVVIDTGSLSRLNFSSPVKITISGMTGKRAAWSLAGNSTLNDIYASCANIADGAGITAGSECYGYSGNDLVIWTYHFTTFAAYTPTLTSSTPPSSGSSVETTIFWTNTQALTNAQFTNGYTKEYGAKHRATFKIGTVSHSMGVISLTGTTATINVSSIPQQKTLSAGDEWKVEVTGDNYYDVLVKLNSISNNKASITLKSINEAIPAQVTPPAAPPATTAEKIKEIVKEPSKALTSWPFWTVVIVIIIIIVVLIFLLKNKKRYYRRGY